MTLDEAIKHEEQIINEHKSIKGFLLELKEYKEGKHNCEHCRHRSKSETDSPCNVCSHNFVDKFKGKR